MSKTSMLAVAMALMSAATGCAHYQTVRVPPEFDLTHVGLVGIIDFPSQSAGPGLSSFTTQRFMQQVTQAQPGVRLLPLGPLPQALASVGCSQLDPNTVKALGARFGVQAIFAGTLEIQKQTAVGISLGSFGVSANVNGSLNATLYDARSGAILWTRGATDREQQAGLSVDPGSLGVEANDNAYTRLGSRMSFRVTDSFRSHWVQQQI
ncbi:MAG: hypothetical protein ACYCWW_20175 [Deltaproteobacteria bacterium]